MPIFLPGPGPLEQTHHAPDAAAGAADSYALIVQSRPDTNYRGSYSAVSGAADEAFPQTGVWASSTIARAKAFYDAPTSSSSSVFFSQTLDTYADFTSERFVDNYSTSGSQVIQPFTQNLDAWAATAFGRATPYYNGPRAITIPVFDPATNTFADWTPAALLSRSTQNYESPAARTLGSFDQPAIISSTDYVAAILSRQQANYRGSYSLIANAADEAGPGVEYAPYAASRLSAYYRSPTARTIPVYFAPGVVVSDPWSQVTQSRRVENYRSPLSRLLAAWDDHACTTLYPDDMLGPDTVLFPDLCPVLDVRLSTHSRGVGQYLAPASTTIAVYTSAAQAADTFAAQARSRIAESYQGAVPFIVSPFGDTAAALVTVALSRRTDFYRSLPGRTFLVYDPATNTFSDWTPGVTQSRSVPWYSARSILALIWDGASGVLPGDPGGGGFGAVMSEDFFKRYDARYKPRYAARYKPTIRKQKP